MKLVSFFLYVNTFIYTSGEKVHQGQFSFPQKYPFTNAGVASERSIYYPEFQTLSPFFTSNNYDDAYKLLPSVQALSSSFPTSIPILITPPTDEISQRRIEANEKFNKSAPTPFMYNQTKLTHNSKDAERRIFPIESQVNYKQPIDRMDTKASAQISPAAEIKQVSTNAVSKKFIIPAENSNNQDLDQKASYHNVQFAPPPSLYTQSTTETAIPILRLSNEMDLDGSFSYEALGADQTHYVQHSRMENLGTDKESQVVEGSYSYVGDNGQTYTVHYIADSNGYRATGDHLPVPPPVPEIIQRSIQYNLAEEAKKPPHLRYYYEDENDAVFNSDKNNQNYISAPNNLFTGRTPEAFSFGLPQRRIMQNDIAPLTNSKDLVNQNVEFSEDKFKGNTNYETLEPQVTFLASQGANSPLNKPQKSALPQLVNYEQSQNKPSSKESENLKTLWRWQYGSNSNNLNPDKNLISRSSSEGDDVIINFNEMSPGEYSKAIRNYENSLTNSNYDLIPEQLNNSYKYLNNNKDMNVTSSENKNYYDTNNHNIKTKATVNEGAFDQLNIKYEHFDNQLGKTQTQMSKSKEIYETNNPYSFTFSTEVPQWFDYESVSYEPKIMASYPADNTNKFSRYEYMTNKSDSNSKSNNNEDNYKVNFEEEGISSSTVNPADFHNVIQYQDNKVQFQEIPMLVKRQEIKAQNNYEQIISTTEGINEMIRDNIFLRDLFNTRKSGARQNYLLNVPRIDSNLNSITNKTAKYVDNEPKFVTVTSPKSANNEPVLPDDIKFEKKPLDMSDVLNYVINKNVFESNKLKVKRKQIVANNDVNQNQQYGSHTDSRNSMNKENNVDTGHIQHNFKLQQQPQEIRGLFKNYKVIQRNNIRKLNTEQENHLQNTHEIKNTNVYTIKLPHLGRAGPSTKNYLPPIYL